MILVLPFVLIVYNTLMAEDAWINRHNKPQWLFWVMYSSLMMTLVTIVNVIFLSFG